VVRSPGDGRFIVRRPADLKGQFARKGDLLAFVVAFDHPVASVIVPEDSADLVRKRTKRVDVRLSGRVADVHAASVVREVPDINDRLPSAALSTMGGGDVVMDPRDPKNLRSLTKILHLEIAFDEAVPVAEIGGRVYVRFDHGYEPIGWRLYRELRQLFLRRFNV